MRASINVSKSRDETKIRSKHRIMRKVRRYGQRKKDVPEYKNKIIYI